MDPVSLGSQSNIWSDKMRDVEGFKMRGVEGALRSVSTAFASMFLTLQVSFHACMPVQKYNINLKLLLECSVGQRLIYNIYIDFFGGNIFGFKSVSPQ